MSNVEMLQCGNRNNDYLPLENLFKLRGLPKFIKGKFKALNFSSSLMLTEPQKQHAHDWR